jgi:hypothetical protein
MHVYMVVITATGGSGLYGYNGDGMPAAMAMLAAPQSVMVDPNTGDIILVDTGNNRLRMINATTGIITTIFGGNVEMVEGPFIPDGTSLDAVFASNGSSWVLDPSGAGPNPPPDDLSSMDNSSEATFYDPDVPAPDANNVSSSTNTRR